MQAAALRLILRARDPAVLRAVLRNWRQSLGAGARGGCASAGWFVALSLSPAAPVRALGVIEAPFAALAGHRLFRETLHGKQIFAGLVVIAGIVLTSSGGRYRSCDSTEISGSRSSAGRAYQNPW